MNSKGTDIRGWYPIYTREIGEGKCNHNSGKVNVDAYFLWVHY